MKIGKRGVIPAVLTLTLLGALSHAWAQNSPFAPIGESSSYKFSIRTNSFKKTTSGGEEGLVAIVRHTVKKTHQVSDSIFLIPTKSCEQKKGIASVISLDGKTGVEMPFVLGRDDATSIIAQVFCQAYNASSTSDKPLSNSISI